MSSSGIESRTQIEHHHFWESDSFKIYLSHILSSWGDRMWSFAVGLYFVILYPQSLQLTAIYGLALCISVIIFGAIIGRWIDRTRRITAAQVALVVQNLSVVICSVVLIFLIHYKSELEINWKGRGKNILIVCVIILAIIANLGSEASKIALEKDWIVVLSGGDEKKLSRMNSTMRSIDLTTFILAPIMVGQIITYISPIAGAGTIAGWNILSGFSEYYLLANIYKRIPRLSQKRRVPNIEIESPHTSPSSQNKEEYPVTPTSNFDNLAEISLATPTSGRSSFPILPNKKLEVQKKSKSRFERTKNSLKKRVTESYYGWKDYFTHPVRNAGIGLALLYMTVLGFDLITTGYAYSQGLSESILSIMTAIGAVFGILGSLSFPCLRSKLGKCKTGNLGFGLETLCLSLCLVSIVSPGSPFVHSNFLKGGKSENGVISPTKSPNDTVTNPPTEHTNISLKEMFQDNISIVLLMTGIILARFGLWVADLSVAQIFQEEVPEERRGVLNGVQSSLNQSMNLLKFILVIILPHPRTFAYLILISWLFVFLGWVFFMIFSCQRPKKSSSYRTTSAHVNKGCSISTINNEGMDKNFNFSNNGNENDFEDQSS